MSTDPLADVEVSHWTARHRSTDEHPYDIVNITIDMGDDFVRRVQVSVSPTGRSIRVWRDGTEMKSGESNDE